MNSTKPSIPIALLVLALGSGLPSGKTLRVAPSGAPFQTLSQALRAASSGDSILVDPGTYSEDLVLKRRISLIGKDFPLIQGKGRGSVITVQADGCRIEGFRIENSGLRLEDSDAGILIQSNGNIVANNRLDRILFGIYLQAGDDNRIEGNRIQGRPELDIGRRGNGIHLWNCARNSFRNNWINQVRDGIYFDHADDNSVEGNRILNSRYGLHYMYSNVSLFQGNLLYGNYAGAALMYSRRITLRANTFFRNRVGYSALGILFKDCDDSVAEGNLMGDNGVGIFLDNSMNNRFQANRIVDNDVAIQLYSSALDNLFSGNVFVNNLSPLRLIGKRSKTRWNSLRGGNYWDGYAGYDLDGDGIGDVPYFIQNIFQYLEGNNPRLRLFLYSPAAQALSQAEQLFPVIQLSEEVDHQPLMRPGVPQAAAGVPLPARERAGLSIPGLLCSCLMLALPLALIRRHSRR